MIIISFFKKIYDILIKILSIIFQKNRKNFTKKNEQTIYEILEINEESKYSFIKNKYKKMLLKNRPTFQNDNSEKIRKIMDAYKKIIKIEKIYLDEEFFENKNDFFKNMTESFNNLELNNIKISNENIKSKFIKYQKKYPKLILFLKKKYLKIFVIPNKNIFENYKKNKIEVKKKENKKIDKEFKCKICMKEYKKEIKYKEHLLTNKHLMKCKELGMKYDRPITEEKIRKIKKKKILRENPEKDSEETKLKNKENIQFKSRESVNFLKCFHCGKNFNTRKDLTVHLQSH